MKKRKNPLPLPGQAVTKAKTALHRVSAHQRAGVDPRRIAWAAVCVGREVLREMEARGLLHDDRPEIIFNVGAEACRGEATSDDYFNVFKEYLHWYTETRNYLPRGKKQKSVDALYLCMRAISHALWTVINPRNAEALPLDSQKAVYAARDALVAMGEAGDAANARMTGLFFTALEAP